MKQRVTWRAAGLVKILLVLLATSAGAVELPDLFTTEVQYNAQRRDARQSAYRRALAQVLARMTPEPLVAAQAFEQPAEFVMGWRESGEDTLWVSFDGRALEQRLQGFGVPVWGSDRPLTVAWVAVEMADGTRTLLALNDATDSAMAGAQVDAGGATQAPVAASRAADTLRSELLAAGSRYGIPVSLPVLDDIDREAVSVSDVWGGFDNVVREATRRYRADSVLIARVPLADPTRARWQWSFAGDRVTAGRSAEEAVATVARGMLEQFAVDRGQSVAVRVSIVGVRGADAYAGVLRVLGASSLVSNLNVQELHRDELIVTLDALAGRERLQQLLAGEQLEPLGAPIDDLRVPQRADLWFRWGGGDGQD